MKKKSLFWAGIILTTLFVLSCKLPDSIELQSDTLTVSSRVKIGAFNIAEVISTAFKDSFPEDVVVLDMTHDNYKDTQTFLIGYEMELLPSFNPGEYLGEIQNQMDDMDTIGPGTVDPIYPAPIEIQMTPSHIESEKHWFDMSELFEDMESQINTNSAPETPISFPDVPIGAGISSIPINIDLPPFMALTESGDANFDSVIVAGADVSDSKIELRLSLAGSVDNDIDIKLTGITLQGATTGSSIGSPQIQDAVLNKANNFDTIVTVYLAGAEISKDDPPKFLIGGIENQYTGMLKWVSFNLIVQPQIRGIALRGATGLKIGVMNPDVPQNIVDAITLGDMPPELLNALVGKGSLTLESVLPPREGVNQTYCTGMTVEFAISIAQDSTSFEGIEFPGLASGTSPLEVGGGGADLKGKYISREPIRVINSKMTIRTGSTGADFELFDNDMYDEGPGGTGAYRDKSLPIMMNMGMKIEELTLVRWKKDSDGGGEIIPTPDVPEIDFGDIDGNGKNISRFIKTITFEKVALNIDFTVPADPSAIPQPHPGQDPLKPGGAGLPDALRDRIALAVTCPDLGLDSTQPLANGINTFSGEPITLSLTKADGITPQKLKVAAELIPVIDGTPDRTSKYMEFGPLVLDSDGNTKLDIYGEVDIDFKWTEALIDLQQAMEESDADTGQLKGTFPGETEPPLGLSTMGNYLNGFTLSDTVRARMYLSGPHQLINILQPTLQFDAQSEGEPEHLVPQTKLTMLELGQLPVLTTEETPFVYSGEDFPVNDAGIDISTPAFTSLIARFPQNLRFAYEMGMPREFIVRPDTFDNTDDQEGAITALIALIIPLELEGEPGAYFSIPDNVFDDTGATLELFGRNSTDEPVFGDVTIKSAGIKLDFDSVFFRGAYLHIADTLFPDGINLNNGSDNSLTLRLSGEDWDTVNNNLIYPEVKVVFPEGSTVRIPRAILPSRITVTGSVGYTVNFDDLGLGTE